MYFFTFAMKISKMKTNNVAIFEYNNLKLKLSSKRIQKWFRGYLKFKLSCKRIQKWFRGYLCLTYCKNNDFSRFRKILENKEVDVNFTFSNKETVLYTLCKERFKK